MMRLRGLSLMLAASLSAPAVSSAKNATGSQALCAAGALANFGLPKPDMLFHIRARLDRIPLGLASCANRCLEDSLCDAFAIAPVVLPGVCTLFHPQDEGTLPVDGWNLYVSNSEDPSVPICRDLGTTTVPAPTITTPAGLAGAVIPGGSGKAAAASSATPKPTNTEKVKKKDAHIAQAARAGDGADAGRLPFDCDVRNRLGAPSKAACKAVSHHDVGCKWLPASAAYPYGLCVAATPSQTRAANDDDGGTKSAQLTIAIVTAAVLLLIVVAVALAALIVAARRKKRYASVDGKGGQRLNLQPPAQQPPVFVPMPIGSMRSASIPADQHRGVLERFSRGSRETSSAASTARPRGGNETLLEPPPGSSVATAVQQAEGQIEWDDQFMQFKQVIATLS